MRFLKLVVIILTLSAVLVVFSEITSSIRRGDSNAIPPTNNLITKEGQATINGIDIAYAYDSSTRKAGALLADRRGNMMMAKVDCLTERIEKEMGVGDFIYGLDDSTGREIVAEMDRICDARYGK